MATQVETSAKSITGQIVPFPGGGKRRRRPPELPRYLTQEELARFRKAVLESGSSRDVAMFGLMYRLGLRACEVARLQVEDVDLNRGRIRVQRAKSGVPKEYPLPRDLRRPLMRWMGHRRSKGPFLFTGRESTNQRGLSVLRVQQLFKRYAARAGLGPGVSSHSLRHSIAVHALDAGFGLEYVQDLLGHTSIRSTAVYAKISNRARDRMMTALDRSTSVVAWT